GGDVNGDGYADMISGAYGNNSNTGKAYVYTNTTTGEDVADVTIKDIGRNGLGYSVSDAGDVNGDGFGDVIVGAPADNTSTPGSAYIFYGGFTLDNIPDVTLTGVVIFDQFGYSVSGAGDVNGDGYSDVVVGTLPDSYNGKAYIYYGGSLMNNTADVIMSEGTINSFGFSVSSAGDLNNDGYDDVIIGCAGYSVSDIGRAYIYFGSGSMNNSADVILTGVAGEVFGYEVSSAGDVNNDGYDDVIAGAPFYSNQTGKAYIYLGGASMNTVSDVILTGEAEYSYFGMSTSPAGDVNADGYSDIVVGAWTADNSRGKAYLYYGGPSMDNSADVTMTGDSTRSAFGCSVSSGDVNGDGYSDIITGAWLIDSSKGKAYIFYGGASMNNVPDVVMSGKKIMDHLGSSVSSAGDMNGDGYSDVIVGAALFPNDSGNVFIYLSSPTDNMKNLFLFGALQGMYNPVTDIEIPDTVKVYLRNSTSPFERVDSSKNILLGPGTGQQFLFRNVRNDIPYYVEVKHRNALTTWSATPVSFVNSDASIAFSVDAIYAYGNNEIQVDASPYNVFAFYSGDINQDGTVDASDLSAVENDVSNSVSGYVPADLNGDDFVDAGDLSIVENNVALGVTAITP
ncbi:MAG TPA: FG-GAP-like repeat-containing protein, partial [Ignavibacteria bacterium]|nr:FG-GAP-like repeat-containing protein [Ignavibacteria bacterium]